MTADQKAKLDEILRAVLELPEGSAVEDLARGTIRSWDSLAQATLIAAIEDEFAVAFEISQYANLESYRGIETTLGATLR